MLTKKQRRQDKNMVSDTSCDVPTKTHSYSMPFYCKPPSLLRKSKDLAMDEFVRGLHELKLKMAKLEEKNQVLEESSKQSLGTKIKQLGGRLLHRCMWCDSFKHSRRECEAFIEALHNNIVFFKKQQIHSREIGLPFERNFGEGGMKVLVDDVGRVHAMEA